MSLIALADLVFAAFSVQGQVVQFTLAALPDCVQCQVGLRGSRPPLSWERSLPLVATGSGTWTAEVDLALPGQAVLEYKYVLEKPDGSTMWELDVRGNRFLLPGQRRTADRWDRKPALDPKALPPLEAAAWQRDLAVLREALLNVHPGTFRYRTRAQIDSMLEATARYFSTDRTRAEGFLAFLKLSAYVQCGHTILNPLNQNDLMRTLMYGQADKLPFALSVLNDELIESLESRVRYAVLPPLVRQHVYTWDTVVYRPETRLQPQPMADGFYLFKNEPLQERYRASKRAYAGQVYLLVDEACSSATFYLARLAKECGMAVLAGSPTGGNQQGINGGTILFLTLPGSGIEVDIPVYGNFNRQPVANGGLEPAIPLARTAADLSRPADAQLEQLLRKIAP